MKKSTVFWMGTALWTIITLWLTRRPPVFRGHLEVHGDNARLTLKSPLSEPEDPDIFGTTPEEGPPDFKMRPLPPCLHEATERSTRAPKKRANTTTL